MPNTLQQFLATAALKAADDLVTALHRLPEDKRNWVPMGQARSALDMVAECAILNEQTRDLIQARVWPEDFDFAAYLNQKAEVAKDEPALLEMLKANTAKAADAIREVPDSDLDIPIDMPWKVMAMSEILAYVYWNMSYHEGQINYIASMLGCLE
ncbi:MAG TPA: DinB family protein [Abditibacteriaceae bacterium]|jgi:uncharacterized damage-inducible protein DinB